MKEQLQEIVKEVELLKARTDTNFDNISRNREDINHNTGAVALLHTLNSNSNKYFIIWIITFIALLGSIGYNIYLLTSYQVVETTTQDVDQINDSGANNYIGRDGDINGKTEG